MNKVLGIFLVSLASLAALASASTPAHAGETLVTAEFAPNPLDPGRNTFRNTTRPGRYCGWRPAFCESEGAYAVDVSMAWSKIYLRGGDIRRRFHLGLPPPRRVELTNLSTGRRAEVVLSIATVSGQLAPGPASNPVFTMTVRGGCSYVATMRNGSWAQFGWTVKNPEAPSVCHSQGDGAAPNPLTFTMSWFGLGLLIKTDSPLTLDDGIYEGETTYTTGGLGSDIDFGDDVTSDPIVLKFRFTVRHDFKVRLADENPQVRLAPEGGWSQWVDHGRRPASLRQELPFHLTSSLQFSMKLRCEHEVGGRCGVRNAVEDAVVPVDLDVTMPGMRNLKSGRPAQFTPLLPDDAQAPRFGPDAYVVDRRSVLRFTADGAAVATMLDAPGSHWEGDMTLVFDANP